MTIKVFKNYGCLAAEYRNVYTYGNPHYTATAYDEITVKIPEDWKTAETETGDIIVVAPWGWTYKIDEVLSGNKAPCFYGYDKNGKLFNIKLEEC